MSFPAGEPQAWRLRGGWGVGADRECVMGSVEHRSALPGGGGGVAAATAHAPTPLPPCGFFQ